MASALRQGDSESVPISTMVYRALRDEIVTLVRPPGSPLSDKEVSRAFGVSRTPVREAFLKLAEEGMIVVRPNSGTFVARIQPSTLYNAHFVRRALECAGIADLGSPPQAEVKALRSLIVAQAEVVNGDDPTAFYKLDDEFHRRLLFMSGHGDAWPVVEKAKAQLDRVRYLAISDRSRKSEVLSQHETIVVAIEQGDTEAAFDRLSEHLRDSFRSVERAVEVFSSYFEQNTLSSASRHSSKSLLGSVKP